MVFRTFTSIGERVPILVEFLAAHGMRRISILAGDTVFGLTCAETFEREAARTPGAPFEIQRFDFPQDGTEDLRPELRKIREFAPDLILNIGLIRTNYMIINQAEELGLLPGTPMMAPFQWPLRSADFWRQAGPAGNLLVWPASQFSPSWSGLTEIGHWFVDRYTEKYGTLPPDTALNTFTDVTIIAQALEALDVPAVDNGCREQLVEMLESRSWNTWRGPVAFTRGDTHWHHSPPPVVLQQYQEVGQDLSTLAIVYPPEHATHDYIRPGGS
jgi:branched-chain amino acid transport system substrate-binding protein